MAKPLTRSDKQLEALKNKYDPEIEGVPNIHRSTEKFDSITQKEIDTGKYNKGLRGTDFRLGSINRMRKKRVREKNQP